MQLLLSFTTATGYWDLDGVMADKAGEMFEVGSALIGQVITQVSLMLKKTGNPTGTYSVVIRKGTDDSIAVTLGTIDASTITTSDKLYTFTNTANTYKIAPGD
jgi:hypothetical protein